MFKANPTPPELRQAEPAPAAKPQPDLNWDLPEDQEALHASNTTEEIPAPTKKRTVGGAAVPWFAMNQLPSQFKAYPPGAKVSYRPYTFNEIETMSSGEKTESERFMDILEGIHTEGMNPLELTMGDFICIAMYRKFKTMGTEEVQITFNVEGLLRTHVMKVNELAFDDLNVELPIIMDTEIDGEAVEVEFMPCTLRQHLAYLSIPEEVRKDIPQHHAWLALGSDQPLEEMLEFVANATGEVMQMLTAIDVALYHGIADLLIPVKEKVTNPDWEKMEKEKPDGMKNLFPQYIERLLHTVRVEVKEDSMLITPFRRTAEASKNGLRFGRGGDS